jgi:basic membrane protein A
MFIRMRHAAIALLAIIGLLLPAHAAATGAASAAGKPLKFVYVTPNPLGVDDFLILIKAGVAQAAAKYHASMQVLESTDPATRQQNVRAAINEGAAIVVVAGFEFNDIIAKVAPQAPHTQFLFIDQCITKPPANVHCAVFREYEAAYLIGVEAGLLTKTNKVGAIGALDIPFLHRYTVGFALGARAANPKVKVSTLWIGSDPSAFSDPVRAKEVALAMAATGADQIFAVGSASNRGIFDAAQQKKFFSYGVDVNQCPLAPGLIVDNLLKRTDIAALQTINAIMSGKARSLSVYGLKEGGVGVVPFALAKPQSSQCQIMKHADVIAKIKAYQDKIISGALKLKDPALSS